MSIQPTICASRGRGDGWQQHLELGGGVSNTITSVQKDNLVMVTKGITITRENAEQYGYPIKDDGVIFKHNGKTLVYQDGVIFQVRIRKLTPTECFRLMDVDDSCIKKIQDAGISKSQQYKMAGNSIVTNVLFHIFRKAFVDTENEEQQLTLF